MLGFPLARLLRVARPPCIVVWGLAALIAVPSGAAAEPPTDFIATVKHAAGAPVVVRMGSPLPVVPGSRILVGDTLRTPPGASLGVVFADDTLLTLGPSSEVAVDDFVFAPAEQKLSFVARILRGTVAYISGQLAKLAPASVKLVAPNATVGTRGTVVLIRVP